MDNQQLQNLETTPTKINPEISIDIDGNLYKTRNLTPLKIHDKGFKYPTVSFKAESGERVMESVHRIFATEYVDNPYPEKYKVVNHKNGDTSDYSEENLEWCDSSYNLIHSIHVLGSNGRGNTGSVSEEDIHAICSKIQDGLSNKAIRTLFKDLPKTFLAELRSGRCYLNISSNYSILPNNMNKPVTENMARWVCRKYLSGNTSGDIFKICSGRITLPLIESIISGRSFSHVSLEMGVEQYKNNRHKHSEEKIREVCELLQEGKTYKYIKGKVGCGSTFISRVKKGEIGVHVSCKYKI